MRGRIHFHEIFQKFRYFPKNMSVMSCEAVFLKYNKYGFFMSI